MQKPTLVLAAAVLVLARAALGAEPASPSTDSPVSRALAAKIDLDFEKTPLDAALRYINEVQPALHLTIDPGVAAAGIDLSNRVVTLKVKGLRVSEVFEIILGGDLAYKAEADRVVVLTRKEYLKDLTTVEYSVADLADHNQAHETYALGGIRRESQEVFGRYSCDLCMLQDLIKGRVCSQYSPWVALWDSEGGRATCAAADQKLVVTQTASGQERIKRLLALLRQALASPSAKLDLQRPLAAEQPIFEEPPSPEQAEIERLLDRRINVNFEMTSLDNVLKYVGEVVPGLNVVIDPDIAAGGIDMTNRVVDLRATQIFVRSVLGLVMSQDLSLTTYRDLDYRVKRGYLLITTGEKVCQDLPIRIYPVADLENALVVPLRSSQPTADPSLMSEFDWRLGGFVRNIVNKENDPLTVAWTWDGGPANIESIGGVWVVEQSAAGHDRVAEFLTLMRRAELAQARLAGAPPGPNEVCFMAPEPEGKVAMRKGLADLIDLDFEQTSLDNVLRYISEVQPGLNIVIDPEVAASGIDLAIRLSTVKVRQIPIEALLALILGSDITYRIENGYVLITKREKSVMDLSLGIYPVADITQKLSAKKPASGGAHGAGVIDDFFLRVKDLGRASPQVAAWESDGGHACLFVLGKVLVVCQTPRGHQRVLENLNKLRREEFAKPAPAGGQGTGKVP